VYRTPNSKNGYLNTLARIMGITIIHPYWAPALVESTKCDVPMAMPAKSRPGPRFLNKIFKLDIYLFFNEADN
jgi:hypothetical protein